MNILILEITKVDGASLLEIQRNQMGIHQRRAEGFFVKNKKNITYYFKLTDLLYENAVAFGELKSKTHGDFHVTFNLIVESEVHGMETFMEEFDVQDVGGDFVLRFDLRYMDTYKELAREV